MRRLILMRHGEAEPLHSSGNDRMRRLTASGLSAATRTGQELRSMGFGPDLILCSDAVRAAETTDAVIRGGGFAGIPVKTLALFYLAEPETILFRCSEVDDQTETLLLIGHNPGWSETATQLCGTQLGLDTAEAALLLHAGTSWSECLGATGTWQLKSIIP